MHIDTFRTLLTGHVRIPVDPGLELGISLIADETTSLESRPVLPAPLASLRIDELAIGADAEPAGGPCAAVHALSFNYSFWLRHRLTV